MERNGEEGNGEERRGAAAAIENVYNTSKPPQPPKKKYKRIMLEKNTLSLVKSSFPDYTYEEILKCIDIIDEGLVNHEIPKPDKKISFFLADYLPGAYYELQDRIDSELARKAAAAKAQKERVEEEEAEKETDKLWKKYEALPPQEQKQIADKAFENMSKVPGVDYKHGEPMHKCYIIAIMQEEDQ